MAADAVPRLPTIQPPTAADDPRNRGGPAQPLLIAQNLEKHFPIRGGMLSRKHGSIKAVDHVSFSVLKGETMGVVGESGCGKSTLARVLMGLIPQDKGSIVFDGELVGGHRGLPMRELRRNMQIVFQDSDSSLNPRLPIVESIAYGPRVHGMPRAEARRLARDLLQRVLQDQGATVTAFETADAALAAVAVSRPSVLISDVGMPGMDGYQMMRTLRANEARESRIPALALTAFARAEDRKRALVAGFQAHLAKPFDVAELVLLVADLVGRS